MFRRTFSALTIAAALGGAVLLPSTALAQSVTIRVPRVYDRGTRDYHRWNGDEDRIYRQYMVDHHRTYRAFSRTTRKQQLEYWQFRHSSR
jgi:hypothetical protein